MIHWGWLILSYYGGVLSGVVIVAFFAGAYHETERCFEENADGREGTKQ